MAIMRAISDISKRPYEPRDESRNMQQARPMSESVSRAICPRMALVIPCHNEEQVLQETATRLRAVLDELEQEKLIAEAAVFFVDDGSADDTWGIIERLAAEDSRFHGLKLSRNFGQQNAILAGLLTVPGDILISIDADLQDDVAAIKEMVLAHAGGAEVVYGIRRNRKSDSFFKRTTARASTRCCRRWACNSSSIMRTTGS